MGVELGTDIELFGMVLVPHCDVSQSVSRVDVLDRLFLDQ